MRKEGQVISKNGDDFEIFEIFSPTKDCYYHITAPFALYIFCIVYIVYIQYNDKNIGGQILVSYFTVLKNEKKSYKHRFGNTTFPRYRPFSLMVNFLETFDTIKDSLQ